MLVCGQVRAAKLGTTNNETQTKKATQSIFLHVTRFPSQSRPDGGAGANLDSHDQGPSFDWWLASNDVIKTE